MTEMVHSIKRVTDIMGEISAASGEQSAGVAQSGEAVGQMDRTTQQNIALVKKGTLTAANPAIEAAAEPIAPLERRAPARANNVTRPAYTRNAPLVAALRAGPQVRLFVPISRQPPRPSTPRKVADAGWDAF